MSLTNADLSVIFSGYFSSFITPVSSR